MWNVCILELVKRDVLMFIFLKPVFDRTVQDGNGVLSIRIGCSTLFCKNFERHIMMRRLCVTLW